MSFRWAILVPSCFHAGTLLHDLHNGAEEVDLRCKVVLDELRVVLHRENIELVTFYSLNGAVIGVKLSILDPCLLRSPVQPQSCDFEK